MQINVFFLPFSNFLLTNLNTPEIISPIQLNVRTLKYELSPKEAQYQTVRGHLKKIKKSLFYLSAHNNSKSQVLFPKINKNPESESISPSDS